MPITKKDVAYVADLARLSLTDEEARIYTEQMQRILGYVEKLSALDTTGIAPLSGTVVETSLRADAASRSITHDDALRNAPDSERGCFKVPKIIE